MTGSTHGAHRLLGHLRAVDGRGAVRMQDRFDSDIDDVWQALTDPERLDRWLGEFRGELRLGGVYRARYHASGWEGVARVEACDPPRYLRIAAVESEDAEAPAAEDAHITEVTLTADGDQTIVVVEERGMPLQMVAGYGAGVQVHVEDLARYLAGQGRLDSDARMAELYPLYQQLAVE